MKNLFLNFLEKNIGRLNKIEKIYVGLFFLSIIAGIIYGINNPSYSKPYEEAGKLDLQEGENNLTIFTKNFATSGIDMFTAGIAGLYLNFVSFSIAGSFLFSQGTFAALFLILFTFGIFELLGSLFFGLIGLNFAQRIFSRFLKVRSDLKVKRVFAIALILLFMASAIEYSLVIFLRA